MLRNGLGTRSVDRLARRRRAGEVKMEYVFGGALAVIIIGAMVLAIMFGFGQPSRVRNGGWRYFCDACQKEFHVDQLPPKEPGQFGPPRLDCPECGGVKTAVQMVKCP